MMRILLALALAAISLDAWSEDDTASGAEHRLARTREQVTTARRELDKRLADLARREREIDARIEAVSRELAAAPAVDPTPVRRELSRAVETLTGGPAEHLEDSLSAWSKAMVARLARATTVERMRGSVLSWDGKREDADIVRLGSVEVASTAPRAALVEAFAGGWRQVGPIVHADEPRGWIPVDVTGKLAAQLPTAQPSLLSRLRAGGLFVFPILGTGLLALALAIERLISFRRNAVDDRLADAVVARVQSGDLEGARRAVAGHRSLTARVFEAGLAHVSGSAEHRATAMGEVILAAGPNIERNITILGMLAAAAPLLGLLGTVSGMIEMFHVLSLHGTGNPRLLSSGISEALICTQLGLLMAVPILFTHAFLSRRVERTLAVIEKQATAFARAELGQPNHAA